MTLLRWIKKVYTLLLALAAIFGVHPGQPIPLPVAPPAAAPVPAAPVPVAPAKKTIGSCSTASDGKQWIASCVVDGALYTLPGVHASHAAAVQAIQAFRAANQ